GGARRFEAIFVGYEEGRIGWRVRDLHGRYRFSRDVVFDDNVPGYLGRVPDDYYAPIESGLPRLPPAENVPQDILPADLLTPPVSPETDDVVPRTKPTRETDSLELRARPRKTRELTEKGRAWQEGITARDLHREELRRRRIAREIAKDKESPAVGVADLAALSMADNLIMEEDIGLLPAQCEHLVVREAIAHMNHPDIHFWWFFFCIHPGK
ncbi:hypothetical protein MPER_00325, partial [Moniliophthora perniciosa FA553]